MQSSSLRLKSSQESTVVDADRGIMTGLWMTGWAIFTSARIVVMISPASRSVPNPAAGKAGSARPLAGGHRCPGLPER